MNRDAIVTALSDPETAEALLKRSDDSCRRAVTTGHAARAGYRFATPFEHLNRKARRLVEAAMRRGRRAAARRAYSAELTALYGPVGGAA